MLSDIANIEANGKTFCIKEQVIDDPVTGLSLIFSGDRLRIVGNVLPFGNRDFQFDKDGKLMGTGVGLGKCALDRG